MLKFERSIKIIFAAIFLLMPLNGFSGETPFVSDYHEKVLDNGARVVAKYVPDSEIVTINIQVVSGLSNEGPYAGSGISHLLEHLIFKGTPTKNPEQLSKEIRAIGGVINGSTSLDSAEYHITLPAKNFKQGLSILTDMVMEPVFSDKDFALEKNIILKEIKFRDDSPSSRIIEKLFSTAYIEHAYRHPLIGYADIFKGLTKEDVIVYHKATYRPDKLAMGIVGGVKPEEALQFAEERLGKYGRGKGAVQPSRPEPEQLMRREAVFAHDTDLGYMAIGFHTTSIFSKDIYPMDVLSVVLGAGNGSLLYERLVNEKKLLYSVQSSNYTPEYPGLFIITGVGESGKLREAEKEIFSILAELEEKGFEASEIGRAKKIVSAGYIFSNEKTEGIASRIADSELTAGSPYFYEKYVSMIEKVNAEDVKNIMPRYFSPDNSTSVYLVPGSEIGKWETTSPEKEKKNIPFEKTITLPNGMKVIAEHRDNMPTVSFVLAFPGGVKAEDGKMNGIANLTSSLLLKGTQKRSEREIIPAMEAVGGNIGYFSGKNSMGVSAEVLSADVPLALDILEDVVKNPVFPEEEIIKEREKVIASIKDQDKDIFSKTMLEARKLLYGNHPYGMRELGEITTVSGLSRQDITDFYGKHFAPENAVLTVTGDVNDAVIADISARFGSWQKKEKPTTLPAVKPLAGPERKDITMEKEQAMVLMVFPGVSVKDDRKYVLSLISSMLSESGGSLFKAVREKEGLAYTLGAFSAVMPDTGFFAVYVNTTEENIKRSEQLVIDTVKKLQKGDFPEELVTSSKNISLTQYALSMEDNSSLATTMALDELYGVGFGEYKKVPEKIMKITSADIKSCAKEFLNTDKCVTLVVHSSR